MCDICCDGCGGFRAGEGPDQVCEHMDEEKLYVTLFFIVLLALTADRYLAAINNYAAEKFNVNKPEVHEVRCIEMEDAGETRTAVR